jgi:radical SAM superfamily enzyme YgiQ (UPF0313 family)
MPLGILYVSAYLKAAGVANVFTLNLNHCDGTEKDALSQHFDKYAIDIVGTGGLSGEFIDVERIIRLSKEIRPQITTLVGGGIITSAPETAMQAIPQADFGVTGEGEATVVELIAALSGNTPVNQVSGLIFRNAGEYVVTPPRKETVDLDALPFPDYEGFNYREYLETNPDVSDDGKVYTQVSVIGGRSCKYNCTFCFHPSGSRYRQRSLDSIFAEIDYLLANYDVTYIALREELFATDNRRVAEFCRRMENYSFDWSIQLRIDSINRQLIDTLKNTRCRYVFVGIESVHDSVLKSMRKGITQKQIETALAMLAEAGICSRSGIIFGDRTENLETAMWTYNWYQENKHRYRMFIDMIIAFPGSKLYTDACREGIISNPVQFLKDGCPIVNISRLSDVEFMQLVNLVEKNNSRKYNVKQYKDEK